MCVCVRACLSLVPRNPRRYGRITEGSEKSFISSEWLQENLRDHHHFLGNFSFYVDIFIFILIFIFVFIHIYINISIIEQIVRVTKSID